MSKKIRATIIGPGNIGTDLLMNAMRSELVEPVWMVGVGVDPESGVWALTPPNTEPESHAASNDNPLPRGDEIDMPACVGC